MLANNNLLWKLKLATKVDYRGKGLSTETATEMLQAANIANGYVKKEKVPSAIGRAALTKKMTGTTTKKTTKVGIVEIDGVKMPAKLVKECQQFMLDQENVDAMFKALFGATSIVEGLVNDVTGKNTGFVLVGGGCGFGIVDGYRKTAKNKAILNLAWGFKEQLNEAVRNRMPAKALDTLMKLGNPVRAMQAQCELYNLAFATIVAEFMNLQGIAGAYGTSRAD